MTSKKRHKWSEMDDFICCEKYYEFFVLNKSEMPISEFIYILKDILADIPLSSLRMKCQNIKQILMDYKIEDTLKVRPLHSFSEQNYRMMMLVIAKYYNI